MSFGFGLESLIPKKRDVSHVPPSVGSVSRGASPSIPPNRSQVSPSTHVPDAPVRIGNIPGFSRPASHAATVPSQSSPAHEARFPRRDDASRERHRGSEEAIFHIEVEKIKPNPYQPRREFDEEALRELAQSIREFGVIQPLLVSKIIKETDYGTDVEYQLIAGERRLMASKLAGLPRVPAVVKKVDEHRMKLELALIENIQRSNLNALEAARAYSCLQDEFGLTQREIAARIGKSREVVANALRLLNLPSTVQQALHEGKINESQARALLSIPDPSEQLRAFDRLLTHRLSVRALRHEVQGMKKAANPEFSHWERQLEEEIGAPVKIHKTGKKGKVVIDFYSDEELQNIIGKLTRGDGI